MKSPVGEMLLKALAKENMRQWHLAEILEVNASTITRIISGENFITDDMAFAIERLIPHFDSRTALKEQIDCKYYKKVVTYKRRRIAR